MAKNKNNSSFVVEILKKLLNHYIVKNIIILSLTGFFIFYGTLVILRHYTHHGESIPLHDVRGLPLLEAGYILHSQKMRWQLSDSVYDNSAKPGAVVYQNPEPGSLVKKNRNVFLIVNAQSPEKVKMPNVVGVSFRQAKSMLESQGLYIGRITYKPDRFKDYVRKQFYRGREIRRGTEIVKGSEIDLEMGSGLSDEMTSVPNLLENSLPSARETLTQYALNFGVIIYDNTVITRTDSVRAFIYQQRPTPTAGAMLRLGSSIDVWLTVDETKK